MTISPIRSCVAAILLVFSTLPVFAQTFSQDQITASYLYNFIKYTDWPNTETSSQMSIGIFRPVDSDYTSRLAKHLQGVELNQHTVVVSEFDDIQKAADFQIVFVEQKNNSAILDLHRVIQDKPVLLVTTNLANKQLVMINLYTTSSEHMRFEINKANLLVHHLRVQDAIIFNGGTEIDVAKLYREGQDSLIAMEQTLREHERKYHLLSKENSSLNEKLAELRKAIAESSEQIVSQKNRIAEQQAQLADNRRQQFQLQEEISAKTAELERRRQELNAHQLELNKISDIIASKEIQLTNLNSTLARQQKRISEMDNTISTQGTMLVNIGILAAGAFLLVAVIIWAYLNKRRDAERLEARTRELNITQDRLVIAKAKAEEANLAKSEFLSLMSHELRTPLQAIIGYTDVVIEDLYVEGMDHLSTDLTRVVNNSQRLLRLINGVLDLAKIESGHMDLTLEHLELHSLVNEAIDNVKPQFDEKNLPLETDLESIPEAALVDREKLLHIILNLLSNACKFTDRGRVTLAVKHNANAITITCRDTGMGIDAAALPFVFDRFQQVDSSATRQHSGSGLGLAITKQFCELMGGHITVNSEPGRGTHFKVEIPLPIKPTPKALEAPLVGAHTDRLASAINLPSITDGPTCILMIDDDLEYLELMSRMLGKAGYRVHTATSAAEGFELSVRLQPRLIILGLLLPDENGWQLLARIKAQPTLADTPTIVASISDERGKSQANAADAFLAKPVSPARLKKAVEKLISAASV
ncbi:YfiR/HmsC family protein [Teredinibacter turnerae]|uniref:YfiR/HmsC family protein n=1 Tax=Teredinibacter turnerae TaxID=2426 RepID=UPI00059F6A78|nr:YfiR/HmsC family protein [Teredinibacter turnerae]